MALEARVTRLVDAAESVGPSSLRSTEGVNFAHKLEQKRSMLEASRGAPAQWIESQQPVEGEIAVIPGAASELPSSKLMQRDLEVQRLRSEVQQAQDKQHEAAMQLQTMSQEVEAWKMRSSAPPASPMAGMGGSPMGGIVGSPPMMAPISPPEEVHRRMVQMEGMLHEATRREQLLLVNAEASKQQLNGFRKGFQDASASASLAQERCAQLQDQLQGTGYLN